MIGDLEGAPTPIEVKVFGDDPDTLAERSPKQSNSCSRASAASSTSSACSAARPRRPGRSIQSAAGRLGPARSQQVSEQLSDAWLGDVQTELQLADRTIPVRVRYPDAYRLDPQQMAATPIRVADGRTVPLGSHRALDHDRGGDHSAAREPQADGPRDRAISKTAIWAAPSLRSRRSCGEPEAAGRLHDRSRRPIRVAAAVVPRAADGLRDRRRARLHHPRRPVRPLYCRRC